MKKMLALVLVILAFFVNVNARAGINDGLVAYYAFANDAIGSSNNGTVYGASPIEDHFGNPENAYYFYRQNSTYIEVPHSQSLAITVPLTLATWVKTSTATSYKNSQDLFIL